MITVKSPVKRRPQRALPTPLAPPKLGPPGNRKLGPGIFSFSLPAPDSCPGMTEVCGLACYVRQGHFQFPVNQQTYADNLAASLRPDFAAVLVKLIRDAGVARLRIHASGDFHDHAGTRYVQHWLAIATKLPHVQFFGYTRSWRVPELLPFLIQLASLPNVQLWWSEDRDTGVAPRGLGIPVAWMVTCPEDEALVAADADLVFRTHPHRRLTGTQKRIKGVIVCPVEQYTGAPKTPLTCSKCKICLPDGKIPPRKSG